MQCPDCHYTDPSDYSDVTSGDCPMCDSSHYRDQPNPIHSEMDQRNMPSPGEEDQGGNPLREGILADNGWQPYGTSHGTGRDESYASTRSHMNPIQQNVIDRQDSVIPWHMAADFDIEQVIEPGPHTVEVDAPGQPLILQHEDPSVLDHAKRSLTANLLGDVAMGAGAAGALALAPETGGASLAAEEALAGGAAAGASRGLLGRAAGGLMKAITPGNVGKQIGNGALRQVGENAIGMGGQPDGGAGSTPEQYRGLDQLSHIVGAFGDDFSSPTSQDHVPSNDTEDPEQVDPKEKNDGDNKDWEKDFSVNGDGGTATPHPFDENGGGLEALELLLPLVLQHHQNGTGHDDPLIQALDQILEGEAPGYKDADPDHEAIELVIGGGKPKQEGPQDDGDEKSLPGAEDEKDDPLVDEDPKKESRVASGPRTPEQFKAVADLLRSTGRDSELQNLIDMPDQYEKELAEVQQRQDITPAETPAAPMPPQPAQEETPPGAGMPMPAPPTGIQPMGAVQFPPCPNCGEMHGFENYPWANGYMWCHNGETGRGCQHMISPKDLADRLNGMKAVHDAEISTLPETEHPLGPHAGAVHTHCPPCPNCSSHTTGFLDNEGSAACKTCHHHWKEDDLIASDGDSSHNTTTSSDHHHDPIDPAADQQQRGDLSQQQDSGLTWQDETGQPLQVGQEYDMYSARYEIPDQIRVTAVKPDAIEYELTSEYGIDHATQITKEDADLYKYTFVPAGLDDAPINSTNDPGIEENNAYAGQADPGQVSDVSHQAAVDPNLAWLMDGQNIREAGANFTLMEQRGFIDERGTARNADKLDLRGTHYTDDLGSGASDDDFLFGL